MSWWTADRQAYALNFLVNQAGLSPYGAAGLVSRWANVESSGGPSSVNSYSGAFGIGQWLGARKTPINRNTDFDAQLAYVAQELSGVESRAGNLLRQASDADSAARGATAYERAEGWNAAMNTDNFTARTAAGVNAVLANWQGAQFQIGAGGIKDPNNAGGGAPVEAIAGIGGGALLLIGGGLLLFLLLRE